jgi:co-chaperonin GroES (HSP10)
MKALGKTILLSKVQQEVKNKAGLVITEFSDKAIRYKTGRVELKSDKVNSVEVGDIVYYDDIAGSEIRVAETKYIVISEDDVKVIL